MNKRTSTDQQRGRNGFHATQRIAFLSFHSLFIIGGPQLSRVPCVLCPRICPASVVSFSLECVLRPLCPLPLPECVLRPLCPLPLNMSCVPCVLCPQKCPTSVVSFALECVLSPLCPLPLNLTCVCRVLCP